MLIPVRCFSCGKPIAQLWEKFKERTEKGESPDKVFASLGMDRYCCRRMFVSHTEYIDQVIQFKGR